MRYVTAHHGKELQLKAVRSEVQDATRGCCKRRSRQHHRYRARATRCTEPRGIKRLRSTVRAPIYGRAPMSAHFDKRSLCTQPSYAQPSGRQEQQRIDGASHPRTRRSWVCQSYIRLALSSCIVGKALMM